MQIKQGTDTTKNSEDLFQGWSLDDEIDIFGENDWKFIDITIKDNNIEYFNDIRDTQFDGSVEDNFKRFVTGTIFVFVFAVLSMLAIQWSGVLNRKDYNDIANIQSGYKDDDTIVANTSITRVGTEETNQEVIDNLTYSIAEYFTSLQAGNLEILYAYTQNSSLMKLYIERKDEIKTTYDVNDCYARLLKYFAMHTRVGQINTVTKNGDTYYVYLNISLPTDVDVNDFVYRNKMNFVKNFNTVELTKENIMKFILKTLETDDIGFTSKEYCLQVKNVNGIFTLADDDIIEQTYTNTYKELLERIVQVVGGDLENFEY